MIYLNTGFFKPAIILFSIIFLPMIIGCCVLTFFDFRLELLIISLIMVLGYMLFVFGIYKYSKTEKYFLAKQENDCIIINYPNVSRDNFLTLSCDDIVRIEYYKIMSVKAWWMLVSCVGPQCAYITYLCDNKEICKLIGYPDYNQISQLCRSLGIEFIVK